MTLILFAAAGNAAGWLIGSRLRARTREMRFGRADAVGGSAVTIAASLLAIWFIALNLVNGPFPGVAAEIRGSAIVRTLDDALPQPPSLLLQIHHFLDRFDFPDVFTGIPPPPGEPVEGPTRGQTRRAFDAAAASTVRVIGEACDRIQEGSGFVIADGYVVTNAHVVAGMDEPLVSGAPDGDVPAVTILFDPDLDLAVLRVPQTPGPPLELVDGTVERGTAGAVIGYPGGGPLVGEPAAVRRTIEAIGLDIYGDGEVVRLVLVLQSDVRPGNSGGPFVLPDGRVGGVVFASSTSENDLGYAIASADVLGPVDRALGSSSEVSTGPCLR